MMGMTCDSSDPFGGLSTQREPVSSPHTLAHTLAHIGLNVLMGHIQCSISHTPCCSDLVPPRLRGERGHLTTAATL